MTKVKEVLALINKRGQVTTADVLGGSTYAHIVLGKLAKRGRIVRIGRGRYASLKSGLQNVELVNHKKVISEVVPWYKCVSIDAIQDEAQIPSRVYTHKIVAEMVAEGVLVRVKRGWYARKGSKFDRSDTPVDPFS